MAGTETPTLYTTTAEPMKFIIKEDGKIEQLRDTRHDDFFDWLACAVVMDSEWDNNPGFYREVICRKLVRLGVLELKGDEYYLPEPKRT